ncbi:2TM domain-containing protein [Flaviaesturariibacter aridisoli]|uniref:2TM domain-containing protein n=1 Tax=Flaviaesturariibacter aridisoli TaxID=2545761 RepID=A0A4R4EAC8_9BACT|nr:2TM domain-containing protein [Flaviaesturariibacter aridisoli]TCZ74785.1 2TM domain-containing protein [Flaviaesturariibacter aridisoli]
MNYNDIPQDKDPHLWRIARRRAGFRRSLFTYLTVNAFLWAIWYFTGARSYGAGVPWPVWPTLGWGIGIAAQWFGAFGPGSNHADPAESEYQKLMREREGR